MAGKRQSAEKRGRRAEYWAAFFLACKFYRVLGLRVRNRAGEIDLVALSPGGILCFIEVKARDGENTAAEAVHARSRERIARASELYRSTRPALRHKGVRFDVILSLPRRLPRHVRDAWRPDV